VSEYIKEASQMSRNMATGMSLAKLSAKGHDIRQKRSPLLVRSDWVLEQIKQREHAKSVKQLEAENLAQWMKINPEWTKYGPELPLTSRGTAAHLLNGVVDPDVLAVTATLGGLAFLYGSWKLWKGPESGKKKYQTFAVAGFAAWAVGKSMLPKDTF
jgi:hypothetical protein